MKQRVTSAFIYAVTAVSLAGFFDSLFGGEPITRHRALIYAATAGAVLCALAALLSLFKPGVGVSIAVVGCLLLWPFFIVVLLAIPWSDLPWFVRYRPDTAMSITPLIASSMYSARMVYLFSGSQRHP